MGRVIGMGVVPVHVREDVRARFNLIGTLCRGVLLTRRQPLLILAVGISVGALTAAVVQLIRREAALARSR
jgi:hypothetical protein